MKKIIASLILLSSLPALACLNDGRMKICPGDMAVVDYADGKVVGVNPAKKQVSVNFNYGTTNVRGIDTYNIDKVTVKKGCYLSYCVGDSAVVDHADGKVVGINPETQKISVQFDYGVSGVRGIGTYDISRVSIGKGCLNGYCVGDMAVVEYADGEIIGINPWANKISINFNQGSTAVRGVDTYNIARVSVSSLCAEIDGDNSLRSTKDHTEFVINFSKQ
ncbi:hypothetical protein [Peredibacter starrii]|uniref:Uncharacterized protein n=1 Tax=Peredibacter starrii TaxID=28202 RepID=A0AAX4HV59_9BACT|nr:hypothetical protein [Peredibacter starrii]WPU66840.1 hypothetical protein SOO65_08770 [Peredibacter starrii]